MIVMQRPRGARLFFVMRGSVLPRIALSLAVCTGLALAVTLAHGWLGPWEFSLTPVPFSLIGLALAIFLGFRNNAAYERWWEGRRLWGELIHRARSHARQWQSLTADPQPAGPHDRDDARHAQVRRAVALAHALRHQLRGSDAGADMQRLLPDAEAAAFAASRLGTDWLQRRMGAALGEALRAGRVDPRLAAEMDATLSGMAAVVAGCERIKGAPIPFAYTLLLHRTATLYCFLLPFGLVDTIGFMTPLVVAIVAYTFFGLDALGDEIEEPFGLAAHHLPLDAMCRTIEINLLEALGEIELPPALLPVDARLT